MVPGALEQVGGRRGPGAATEHRGPPGWNENTRKRLGGRGAPRGAWAELRLWSPRLITRLFSCSTSICLGWTLGRLRREGCGSDLQNGASPPGKGAEMVRAMGRCLRLSG